MIEMEKVNKQARLSLRDAKDGDQRFCISARCRFSGFTESITGPMSHGSAVEWMRTGQKHAKSGHKYFRISKFPFKRHKK